MLCRRFLPPMFHNLTHHQFSAEVREHVKAALLGALTGECKTPSGPGSKACTANVYHEPAVRSSIRAMKPSLACCVSL